MPLCETATLAFSALSKSLGPTVGISEIQRKTNIKAAKKQCTQVGVDAMNFFASHAWTGTHQGRDFGAKIASVYCLIRVHNTAITASGRDTNYNKGKDQRGEEEEEEEYGIQERDDEGGDGGRGRRKCH